MRGDGVLRPSSDGRVSRRRPRTTIRRCPAAAPGATAPSRRRPSRTVGAGLRRPAAGARPGALTKFSAPPSPQARLDTRPGSHAGVGDAGREPPLPPGGIHPWVSALAAAASGAGPSGIAAILLAFALVPPLLLRAREGSVVRRPIDVLAPVDVPV